MSAYEDKGYSKIPRETPLRISFSANIRFLFGLYQDDILVLSSDEDKGNEVEISPDGRRTILKWSVMPCESGVWTYTVVIKADGKELARIENEVESDIASFQRYAVIIQ